MARLFPGAPCRAAIAAFLLACGAARAAGVTAKAKGLALSIADVGSVNQIRDTLKNLLKSIEDESRDAEGLERQRSKACDSILRKAAQEEDQARTGLAHLEADLKEHEAAVEEAEGTVQQLRADAELVAHTLNQTQEVMEARRRNPIGPESQRVEDGKLLKVLLQNKQQTLTSLEGELEVILPALSQLQASVAESRRRLSDRKSSADAAHIFAMALKASCSNGAKRASSREEADTHALNSIESALQELEAIATAAAKQQATSSTTPPAPAVDQDQAAPVESSPPADAGEDADLALSFVQVNQDRVTTEDDLMSIFGGTGAASAPPVAPPQHKVTMGRHRGHHHGAGHHAQPALLSMAAPTSGAGRPHIQKLLSSLRVKAQGQVEQKEWCAQEGAQNQHVLKLVQASIQEMSAEIDSHNDTEAQLTDDLNRIAASNATFLFSYKAAMDSQAKEQDFLKSSAKDHALASKILSQAITILSDLRRNGGAVGKMLDNLKVAKSAFDGQMQSLPAARKDLALTAKALAKAAMEGGTALESERVNLEMARFSHVSQRARCEESQHMFEAEAEEVAAYLKSLTEECKGTASALEDQERRIQVRALEDAAKVAEGKKLQKDVDKAIKSVKEKRNLSPMERAAAEMGVAVDSS